MFGLKSTKLFVILIFAVPVLACGGTRETATPTRAAMPTWTPTAEAATPAPESRCVPASDGMLLRIRTGVKGVDSNNDIKTAWAVKSNDFANVWMVAAKIYGPGMETGTGPGLWAINGELEAPGLTFAVDGFANEFSDWGDGTTTDVALSIANDGAREALDCALND